VHWLAICILNKAATAKRKKVSEVITDPVESAKMAGLRYVTDSLGRTWGIRGEQLLG
jgi:hypothetical protein